MNPKLSDKLKCLATSLAPLVSSRAKHFSFIVLRNRVISVGWNQSFTTHPKAKRFGHRFDAVHSELDALVGAKHPHEFLRRCTLVNVRLNRFGKFGMAKPCRCCTDLLRTIGFREVWFTNTLGEFERL